METLETFDWWGWLGLPLLIAASRVVDVSIGTIRVIAISRGYGFLGALSGFFEVLVWLLVMRHLFQNLDNWPCVLGYAAGFSVGNYIGVRINGRLALGRVMVQIVTRRDGHALVAALREDGLGVTTVDAEGAQGAVQIIYTCIAAGALPRVLEQVRQYNPQAFYTVEDVREANAGVFPAERRSLRLGGMPVFKWPERGTESGRRKAA